MLVSTWNLGCQITSHFGLETKREIFTMYKVIFYVMKTIKSVDVPTTRREGITHRKSKCSDVLLILISITLGFGRKNISL